MIVTRATRESKVTRGYECGGAKEEGQNAARDALNAHPDLAGIFAINDPAALGARAALEAEGKADQIVVVGFDGQSEAKQAIKEGKLFDSPVQFPDRLAIESVKAILQYFDGEIVELVMLIPSEAYRKEQADADPTLNKISALRDVRDFAELRRLFARSSRIRWEASMTVHRTIRCGRQPGAPNAGLGEARLRCISSQA